MSEQESSCYSQGKSRVAENRAGIEMLMSEAELNIQFNSFGSRWSRKVKRMMKDLFRRHNGPCIRCALLMVICSAAGVNEKERTGL